MKASQKVGKTVKIPENLETKNFVKLEDIYIKTWVKLSKNRRGTGKLWNRKTV